MSIFDERIENLREQMQANGISFYFVTTEDFHGSEYVSSYFKCREFLSGFTGSAGTLLVTLENAYLYTDGRYFIQAEAELKESRIELMKSGEEGVPKLSDLLVSLCKPLDCIGFDGRTVSIDFYNVLKEKLPECSFITELDLVDKVWAERPNLPNSEIWNLDVKYAGESRKSKISRVREFIQANELDGIFISALDEVNWLLNIRGGDIDYCPLALSYAYVSLDKFILFVNAASVGEELTNELEADGICLRDYFEAYEYLKSVSGNIGIDFKKSNTLVLNVLSQANVVSITSPIALMKAKKNETEIANIKQAHVKDAVAMCKFLCALSELESAGKLTAGEITEKSLEKLLLDFRRQGEGFIEESFAPIIASGSHGAIVHYEATESTDKPIENNTLLLMDTGGHYYEGTTDITRTIAIGEPSEEMIYHYTLVLKSHIALALQVFNEGTAGKELDSIARKPIWDAGLDFNHGTGHGVGYLLNVHEGPQNISFRAKSTVAFEAGMLITDEPGLYLEGKYGIRTENILLCEKDEKEGLLHFKPLTLVPYDKKLINKAMLTVEEIDYLDYYSSCVYNSVEVYLQNNERKWLRDALELERNV